MTQCFRQVNGGNVTSFLNVHTCDNFSSSTNFNTCCFNGHICVASGLCYAPKPDAGTTGFYEALCSDSTYQDASCGKRCTAWTKGDGVYDAAIQAWRCCGADADNRALCQNPTNVTFAAPSPSVLLAAATASVSSTISSSSGTSVTSGSATSSNTSARSSSASTSAAGTVSADTTSSGLSGGAKAGIGIGVAVVVLAIIGAIIWALIIKRRRTKPQSTLEQPTHYYGRDKFPTAELSPAPAYPAAEMSGGNYVDAKPRHQTPINRVYEMGN